MMIHEPTPDPAVGFADPADEHHGWYQRGRRLGRLPLMFLLRPFVAVALAAYYTVGIAGMFLFLYVVLATSKRQKVPPG